MALRHGPVDSGRRQGGRVSTKEAAFRTHLAVFLGVGLFLVTLNLLTSPFDLWFSWPLFFWGWGLVFHAVATYGADAPSRVSEVLRSLLPWLGSPRSVPAIATVHERVERIREMAWRIEDAAEVRGQLQSFCDAAENIVAAMALKRGGAAEVRRFDAKVLTAVVSLLDQYVDAVRNAVARGDEAARRIAKRGLPLALGHLHAWPEDAAATQPTEWLRSSLR